MITYKGDNLVVGKKFIIEGEEYVYRTKKKDEYIFESENNKLSLSEKEVIEKGLK